jgi:hypothetical protein
MNRYEKIVKVLQQRHPYLPTYQQWKQHWDAMYTSYCGGCPYMVQKGQSYWHHPWGVSYHLACVEKLLEKDDADV